jgi:hypothetical protein
MGFKFQRTLEAVGRMPPDWIIVRFELFKYRSPHGFARAKPFAMCNGQV